jgi:hypothetical protein
MKKFDQVLSRFNNLLKEDGVYPTNTTNLPIKNIVNAINKAANGGVLSQTEKDTLMALGSSYDVGDEEQNNTNTNNNNTNNTTQNQQNNQTVVQQQINKNQPKASVGYKPLV